MASKNYNSSSKSRNYSSNPTYGTTTTTTTSTTTNSSQSFNGKKNDGGQDPCANFMTIFNKFRPCIQNVCKSVTSSNFSNRHPCFQRCRPFYASHPPPPQNPFPCFNPYQYALTQQGNGVVTIPPGGLKPCTRNGNQHQMPMNQNRCVNKVEEKKCTKQKDKKSALSSYYGTSSSGGGANNSKTKGSSSSTSSSYYYSSSSGSNSKTKTSSSYKTPSKSSPSSNGTSCSSAAGDKMKKAVKSRSHEGIDFCFEPVQNLATEVTVCIEPDEPEVLEYAIENGIMPIICGYLPPSGAPVIPQFLCNQQQQFQQQRPSSTQSSSSSSSSSSEESSSDEDSSTSTSSGSTTYDSYSVSESYDKSSSLT